MRSHLEEQVADLLDQMKVPYQYESEKLPYLIEANYIPDFKVGAVSYTHLTLPTIYSV